MTLRPSSKLTTDILWTVGSFGILAASGIVINIAIAGLRDASSLGLFNITYAIYMIASQFAVWGVHYSVLRSAAYWKESTHECGYVLGTALVSAALGGLMSAAVCYLAAPLIATAFASPGLKDALHFAALGLMLFPLSKVLIAYTNALRHMRAYSVLQSCRYLVITACVVAISATQSDFTFVTIAFFIGELITTLAALAYLAIVGHLSKARCSTTWIREHLTFGSKSLFSGLFVEMNSRLDVLLIGIFMNDFAVGVYSFAAMLVDGLYHLWSMVRVNLNPILVAIVRDSQWNKGRRLLGTLHTYALVGTAILASCVMLLFVLLTYMLIPDKGLQEGTWVLLTLLVALTIMSPYIPFESLLLVSGYPFWQTVQNLTVVTVNVVTNIALVPLLGIEGAALATSAGYFAGIATLVLLVQKLIGWNLVTNLVTHLPAKR